MKILTKIAIAAIAVLFLAAALVPAQAACGGNPLIRTAVGAIPAQTFIWSAGQWGQTAPTYAPGYPPIAYYGPSPLTANTQATFWALGTGNPAIGPGDDAGAYTFAGLPTSRYYGGAWLYAMYQYTAGAYNIWHAGAIFTGWGASAAVDGCLQNNPPNSCTCVLITDHDGSDGYFALASNNAATGTWFTDLDQPGNDGAGNLGPIVLQAIPAPTILGAVRKGGSFDLDLTATVAPLAGPAQGIYQSGGACPCGPTGFKVMESIVLRGAPAPSTRDASLWTAANLVGGALQGFTPMGSPVTVESLCGSTDNDVYITTLLEFDSGFTSPVVSGDATRIECGPNVAEPARPRLRPSDIDRTSPRTPTRGRR